MDQLLNTPMGQALLQHPQAREVLLAIRDEIHALPKPQARLASALVSVQQGIPAELKSYLLRELHAREPMQPSTPIWRAAADVGRAMLRQPDGQGLDDVAPQMALLQCMGLMTELTFAGLFLVSVSDHLATLAVQPGATAGPAQD